MVYTASIIINDLPYDQYVVLVDWLVEMNYYGFHFSVDRQMINDRCLTDISIKEPVDLEDNFDCGVCLVLFVEKIQEYLESLIETPVITNYAESFALV